DAACSTLGAGVICSGQVQAQGGQAGGMSVCTDTPISHPKLILSPHVVQNRWLLQGVTIAGGASIQWFASTFGAKQAEKLATSGPALYQYISEEAEASSVGANGIIFLPYLQGERSPLWDSEAKGVYFGFGLHNTHADFVRATMEGVAYSLRHNLDIALQTGIVISEIYATDGSANSRIWTQIKADVVGIPIYVRNTSSTAWGAAMLAGIGAGVFADAASAVAQSRKNCHAVYPIAEHKGLYDRLFEIYKELYHQTKSSMHSLSKLAVQ
ncbi:MAG: carbohydrate kinase, partial [Oscillospiraceae bacterium]|nr:carbohydrate kinase [Oscillospiraceae bacterium]